MDPFSVISDVAGVATAAASLASTLHNLISDIRDAPRKMRDMAGGVRELSGVLRELRGILRKGKGLFRDKLYRSIDATMRRVKKLHVDIRELIASDRGVSRLVWALRSQTRAERLLGKIDSLKLGLLLKLKTMSLVIAIEQRLSEGETRRDREEDNDKAFLRRQLEMLIQTAKQSIRDAATPPPTPKSSATQTDLTNLGVTGLRARDAWPVAESEEAGKFQSHEMQLQKWDDTPDDSARILYRLVF